jgi:hypothetical protein
VSRRRHPVSRSGRFGRDSLERARHRIAVGELVDRSGAGDCANYMQDPEVLAKRDVAVEWCRPATHHAASYGGKPGTYLLIHTTQLPRT